MSPFGYSNTSANDELSCCHSLAINVRNRCTPYCLPSSCFHHLHCETEQRNSVRNHKHFSKVYELSTGVCNIATQNFLLLIRSPQESSTSTISPRVYHIVNSIPCGIVILTITFDINEFSSRTHHIAKTCVVYELFPRPRTRTKATTAPFFCPMHTYLSSLLDVGSVFTFFFSVIVVIMDIKS